MRSFSIATGFADFHEGKVKSIGVSNFSQAKLEEILPTAEVIPVVNQVSHFRPTSLRPNDDTFSHVSWNSTSITRNTTSLHTRNQRVSFLKLILHWDPTVPLF